MMIHGIHTWRHKYVSASEEHITVEVDTVYDDSNEDYYPNLCVVSDMEPFGSMCIPITAPPVFL